MRLHRFFIEEKLPTQGKVKIKNDDIAHQWRNVLRFQVGQELFLFDNSGREFRAVLSLLTNREAEVEIVEAKERSANSANHNASHPSNHTTSNLFLYLALAKRDSFELTLEKATELGVAGFVPIVSERSEKKTVRIDRSQNILKEASEQSGRVIVPEISEPASLVESLQVLQSLTSSQSQQSPDNSGAELSSGFSFALDPRGESFVLSDVLSKAKNGNRLNIFIGPEGGFSPAEIDLFKANNIPIYSLGDQILRAETAAIAITAMILLNN